MSITVTCPNGHLLHVEDKHAGRSGKCPHCHFLVHVPKPGQVLEDEILAIIEPPAVARPRQRPVRSRRNATIRRPQTLLRISRKRAKLILCR